MVAGYNDNNDTYFDGVDNTVLIAIIADMALKSTVNSFKGECVCFCFSLVHKLGLVLIGTNAQV